MSASTLAPVALFVYNRPEHTRQTIEALASNPEAALTRLYVFSDAAKSDDAVPAVAAIRSYLRTIEGFGHVEVVERDVNFGLARSIIDGVTRLCQDYGRVIVLEDDLVTSPYFLRYMNDALDLYADEERVMHVSGSAYPIGPFSWHADTYFLRVPLCWGWGTWGRAWDKFEKDPAVMQKFDTAMIKSFNFDDTYNYWQQLELNQAGKINTWFVFWYAQIFVRKGLALFPAVSLVRNIGHDGTGVHCGETTVYDMELSTKRLSVLKIPLEESTKAFVAHKKYFRKISPSLARRIFTRTRRLLSGLRASING
jgi:hypothetical protein